MQYQKYFVGTEECARECAKGYVRGARGMLQIEEHVYIPQGSEDRYPTFIIRKNGNDICEFIGALPDVDA